MNLINKFGIMFIEYIIHDFAGFVSDETDIIYEHEYLNKHWSLIPGLIHRIDDTIQMYIQLQGLEVLKDVIWYHMNNQFKVYLHRNRLR